MSQNRDAPAYQEYAANMLARREFRTMTLHDRGLLFTLKMELWVNRTMPNDHDALAKMLSVSVAEIAKSLPAVMPFFKIDGNEITCPELNDYRAYLESRREKQSRGGRSGASLTNSKHKTSEKAKKNGSTSTPSSYPRVPRRGQVESLVQSSTEKQSQTQSPKGCDSVETDMDFVAAYERYEATEGCTSDAYATASGSSTLK